MPKSLEDYSVDELLAYARVMEPQSNAFSALTKNPETRETIQRALKKLNPNLSIPEIDAKDAVRSELKVEVEKREALERRIMENEARDNVRERRAAIKAKYRLSDADVEGVEKLMVEDKDVNWTHDAAARVYLAQRQSATPTPATLIAPTFSLTEGKDDKWAEGMMGNAPGGGGTRARLDRLGMNAAFEAWNEISGGKVPGLGSAKAN
jgi:hypothetical protein